MARAIKQDYVEKWVDETAEPGMEELVEFVEETRDEFVVGHIERVTWRWRLMNVYLFNGMPRPETARLARQIAQRSAQWMGRKMLIPAPIWTLNKCQGPLMPIKGTDEWKELCHRAASLDISEWLGAWRQDVLTYLPWWATRSWWALSELQWPRGDVDSLITRSSFVKQTNALINAFEQEVGSVAYAIRLDRATPRAAQAESDSEE